ncbi:MAG TPA: exodeoxyribonuclease III [Solirubrobacteraceae bacterium]|nr:exodeoxyribonuclease III [Solirubrobacteraceae bacterium]
MRGAHGNAHALQVVSWNVNGIRARWPRLEQLLKAEQPDVVCIQETRCPENRFPLGELQRLGYRCQHSPGAHSGGVAILVRSDHHITHRSLSLDHHHDIAEGHWLEVTMQGLTIGCVYVPAGPSGEELDDAAKLQFLEAVAHQAYDEHSHPLLIAGDFNVAPTDQDVYEPRWFENSYHTARAEREDLREILEDGELVDVYRVLHPDDRGYTCWDQREGHYARDLGMRIDLFLASESLAEHVVRCEVNHEYRQGFRPSNHAPLEITLDDIEECAHCLDGRVAA